MKRAVRYFVSYAHDDGNLPRKLLEQLVRHLRSCQDYTFIQWQDTAILPGEKWHAEIQNAVHQCDFGLLLVSPSFLGSDYIGKHELPPFISGEKPCLPIALCRIDFKNHDLKGLDDLQLFRYQSEGAKAPRAFADYSAKLQADFALALFQQITARLKKLFGDEVGNPPADVRPSTSTPNNLPHLQPFFGRREELKKIRQALHPRSRRWGMLIVGAGGTGKTSLAVRAAYRCAALRHFERIVFVSLKQQEQDDDMVRPLGSFALSSWPEMLTEIAQCLELPGVAKEPEEARAGRLKVELQGRKVLLVLDNLETLKPSERDELFSFLRFLPKGCKALLTSWQFAGQRGHTLTLREMDRPSARRLLAEIAKHNPAFAESTVSERRKLYDETHGNALLMRWVGGQVGCGPCTSIGDALDYLRTCPANNNPLGFIFDHVVRSLGETELRLLGALAWPVQSTPVTAIAEIAKVSLDEAHRSLKFLSNHSLVVPDQDEKAYALLSTAAHFLREKKRDVIEEAGARLESYICRLVEENGQHQYGRFSALDESWPAIAAALPLFLQGPNDRLQWVCHALEDFLNFTGRWDEWLSLSAQAEPKAAASGDWMKAGWRAHNAGYVHVMRDQPERALECAARAAQYWETLPPIIRERGFLAQLRALAYERSRQFPLAIAAHQEALEIWLGCSAQSFEVAVGLFSLAGAERRAGQQEAAAGHLEEALRVARAVGYSEGIAYATGNQAALALAAESWEEAEAIAREALDLSERLGSKQLIASNSRRLARALLSRKKIAEARLYARRALRTYRDLNSPGAERVRKLLRECEASESAQSLPADNEAF